MRQIVSVSLLMCSIASSALAQNARSCDRLIDHGINNITRLQSAESAIVYKWNKYCRINFESSSDSVIQNANVAVFGYGDGGASNNTSQQRIALQDWCDENKEFAENKSELFEEASIISQDALASWDRCIEMARKDIFIDFAPIGDNAGLVQITIDSTQDSDLVYLGTQTSGFTCTERMVRTGTNEVVKIEEQPKIGNANIQITCERNAPAIAEVKGTGTITFSEGWISVNTSGPALPIGFPEVISAYEVTPPSAIVAFQSATCPPGWFPFHEAAGRTLVGAGQGEGLSMRTSGETGGEENHTLTIPEMPSHKHRGKTSGSSIGDVMVFHTQGSSAGKLSGNVPFFQAQHTHNITAEGEDKPHENMQPFLVMNYCKRGV